MSTKSESHSFTIVVERVQDFEFRVRFDKEQYAELTMDEPKPVGQDVGPNATRVLSAAVGNCLAASLMFCVQRSKLTVRSIKSKVTTTTARNEEGRWRVARLQVQIFLKTQDKDEKRLQRCIDIFENYCVVTGSVRQGIPVDVTVITED